MPEGQKNGWVGSLRFLGRAELVGRNQFIFYNCVDFCAAKMGLLILVGLRSDPVSFAAMESDTHLLYFTKLSSKSFDFNFLVGIHLKVGRN